MRLFESSLGFPPETLLKFRFYCLNQFILFQETYGNQLIYHNVTLVHLFHVFYSSYAALFRFLFPLHFYD